MLSVQDLYIESLNNLKEYESYQFVTRKKAGQQNESAFLYVTGLLCKEHFRNTLTLINATSANRCHTEAFLCSNVYTANLLIAP